MTVKKEVKDWQDRYILRQAGCWSEGDIDCLIQKLRETTDTTDTTQSLFPNWAWYNDPTVYRDNESGLESNMMNKKGFWNLIVMLIISALFILWGILSDAAITD